MASWLILDNGASSIKAGLANSTSPRVIPNCVTKSKSIKTRNFVGDQINECTDCSGLYYQLPCQKGFLVNWELEKVIWDRIFSRDVLNVANNLSELGLVVTEPYFNLNQLRDPSIEVLFEEFNFNRLLMSAPALFSHLHRSSELQQESKEEKLRGTFCSIVVDSGFSYTLVVPCCGNSILSSAIRRIDVGGKFLTNYLKDVISYRQLLVADQTYVVNAMKEDISFVSLDFDADLRACQNHINRHILEYVLPDFSSTQRGYIRGKGAHNKGSSEDQILSLANERFSVPEVLFRPSDVGLEQMGISEAIVASVNSLPEEFAPHLYANIILMGGNASIPGFAERVLKDVREMVPDMFDVSVRCLGDPVTSAWQGAKQLATGALDLSIQSGSVSRSEYFENGLRFCTDRFETFTYGMPVNV